MALKLKPWEIAEKVLPHTPRVLLFGPPGTGKTKFPYDWASRASWEHLATTLTEETPSTVLMGSYMLKGGEFVWGDGLVSAAWRKSHSMTTKGVVVVINEIDHSSADVQTILHAALDDEGMAAYTLPTGETIRPAKGKMKYVATMNGLPEDLNPALRDRFPVTININEVHPEAIKALPEDLRALAANGAVAPDPERRVSVRAMFEFASLRSTVGDVIAAQGVFGARAQELLDALAIGRSGAKR